MAIVLKREAVHIVDERQRISTPSPRLDRLPTGRRLTGPPLQWRTSGGAPTGSDHFSYQTSTRPFQCLYRSQSAPVSNQKGRSISSE